MPQRSDIYVCMYACMYVYNYMCIYIYIYTISYNICKGLALLLSWKGGGGAFL